MIEGGTSSYYACHIKDLGSCKDSTSDYCNNGQDYMCPSGFSKKAAGPYSNTINDCESCGAGAVCSDSTTETLCPDGYNCEAMTDDVYSKPGQPGELLTRDAFGVNNDIGDCTGGYCEGATYDATLQTCPTGYYLTYTGTSAGGQHSKAGCSPVAAGNYGSPAVVCDAGFICPPGSSAADISIPPGWFSASTGVSAFSDSELTLCPAGKFCAAGSITTGNDCDAGYYCSAGTVFQYDTPCDFGQTSTAGAGAYGDCSACTDGEFCRQGLTAPLTDGSYCGSDNFLCIGGNLKRTICADG